MRGPIFLEIIVKDIRKNINTDIVIILKQFKIIRIIVLEINRLSIKIINF